MFCAHYFCYSETSPSQKISLKNYVVVLELVSQPWLWQNEGFKKSLVATLVGMLANIRAYQINLKGGPKLDEKILSKLQVKQIFGAKLYFIWNIRLSLSQWVRSISLPRINIWVGQYHQSDQNRFYKLWNVLLYGTRQAADKITSARPSQYHPFSNLSSYFLTLCLTHTHTQTLMDTERSKPLYSKSVD